MVEQHVAFQLANQIYALEVNSIREIIRLQPVIEVPEAPEFIAGIISLREKVIPVINLHRRFGFPCEAEVASSRIIIMEIEGFLAGIKVDAVLEVLQMSERDIEQIPVIALGLDSAYLKGIARWRDKLLLVLDADRLFRQGERKQLQSITTAC